MISNLRFIEEPEAQAQREDFETGLLAGCAVLDRECFRLVPDCQTVRIDPRQSLVEASNTLMAYTDLALLAAEEVDAGRYAEIPKLHRWRRKKAAHAIQQFRIRKEALQSAFNKVFPERAADKPSSDPIHPDDIVWRDPRRPWVTQELVRRIAIVETIMVNAGKVPARAILETGLYQHLLEAFPTDPEYEKEVQLQATQLKNWLREVE